jgi:hypothetical protein
MVCDPVVSQKRELQRKIFYVSLLVDRGIFSGIYKAAMVGAV